MKHTHEYKRYFETDYADKPRFAGTTEMFEIGDNVEANGKNYEIYSFFRSVHANDNEIDWVRISRTNDQGTVIWCDVYPSELTLKSRPVDYDYEKHMECTESEWR